MLRSVGGRAPRLVIVFWGMLLIQTVCGAAGLATASSSSLPNLALEPLPRTVGKHQGVLYRVGLPGRNPAYLFGTVHVGTSALYPLPPHVLKALDEADALIVELDIHDEQAYTRAVSTHGSYRTGSTVTNHLTPAAVTQLTAVLHALGITVASVSHLKPWLIANLLMGWELQRNGLQRTHGNETFLLEHAQAHGREVVELESADYQLALFATLSDHEAERYLLDALAQLADGSSLRQARATIDAWRSGDASALAALVPNATGGGGTMAAFTRQVLLGRRNPEMATNIERVLQSGKTSFVGVGLLHLLGADGLPRLLSQRGYRVERVD